MDFGLTKEQMEFQQEVIDFLDKELPPGWAGIVDNGDRFGEENWKVDRTIARRLAQKGWLALSWPKEYGGQARSSIENLIFREEIEYRGAPGVDQWGSDMVGPTLLKYGTEEQRRKFLPQIAKAEIVWCQGFSEPEAGSDLASLQTRAEKRNGDFIINGEKIWTSGAHRSDWMILLARTDPGARKHRGISYFLVPLKTPGITIIPIMSMSGFHQLNRVVLSEVPVPREHLVGEENMGWYVAAGTLNFERSGIERIAICRRYVDRLIAFVKGKDCSDALLQKLSQLLIELEVGRLLAYRVGWLQERGEDITAVAAISKVFGSELMQRVSRIAMEITGSYGRLSTTSNQAVVRGGLAEWHASNVGRTMGAGTSEIQRNIIAIRGLGLPRK